LQNGKSWNTRASVLKEGPSKKEGRVTNLTPADFKTSRRLKGEEQVVSGKTEGSKEDPRRSRDPKRGLLKQGE